MPRKQFGNELDKPIKVKSQIKPSFINSDQVNKQNQEIIIRNALSCTKQSMEKLDSLLNYYKVDKDSQNKWLFLSLALAKEYVRGFKIVDDKVKTKPIKWTQFKYAALYFEVELKKKLHPKQTYGSICSNLQKEEAWLGEERLHRRYSEAKDLTRVESGLVKILINAGKIPEQSLCSDLLSVVKAEEVQKPSEF